MKAKKFLLTFLMVTLSLVAGVPSVSLARLDQSSVGATRKPEQETKFHAVEGGIPNRYIVAFDHDRLAFDAGISLSDLDHAEQDKDLFKQEKQRIAQIVEDRANHLARAHYATIDQVYTHTIRGFSAEMSEAEAKALSEHPDVRRVEQDRMYSVYESQNNPPWGLDRIDQRSLPFNKTYNYTSSGAGVNVYVLDSGIRTTHTEFGGRASIAADYVDDPPITGDCLGHGTHVAGTIGGATYGVAKAVTLHSVRVVRCDGQALASRVIKGIVWVTENHVKPAVVNMSLGFTGNDSDRDENLVDEAVRESIRAGITYVVAAGNDNKDTIAYSPARVHQAIVVAAIDSGDKRWAMSNFGDSLDVFAPGVDIPSAGVTSDTAKVTKTATSMAAPHVTGVAALYLERHPSAKPADIEHRILNNATNDKIIDVGLAPNGMLHTPANVYQLHRDGRIWQYNEPEISGWEEIDDNPATSVLATDEGNLYQLHNNGWIWKYTGTPHTGWQLLDNNSDTAAIVADGKNLYQLHYSGLIWKYTGTPLTGWQLLGNNPDTVTIVASGGSLYQLRSNGSILKYTGKPSTGWQLLLDDNSDTKAIVADGKTLYRLHYSGWIFKYTGTARTGWQLLDNNSDTATIIADEGNLYQLHDSGLIWKYTGTPLTGWQLLGDNPNTTAIVVGEGNLYQLNNNGLIWKYTGTPITGWQLLDNNPATIAFVAD